MMGLKVHAGCDMSVGALGVTDSGKLHGEFDAPFEDLKARRNHAAYAVKCAIDTFGHPEAPSGLGHIPTITGFSESGNRRCRFAT
jgi:hypothetical protein